MPAACASRRASSRPSRARHSPLLASRRRGDSSRVGAAVACFSAGLGAPPGCPQAVQSAGAPPSESPARSQATPLRCHRNAPAAAFLGASGAGEPRGGRRGGARGQRRSARGRRSHGQRDAYEQRRPRDGRQRQPGPLLFSSAPPRATWLDRRVVCMAGAVAASSPPRLLATLAACRCAPPAVDHHRAHGGRAHSRGGGRLDRSHPAGGGHLRLLERDGVFFGRRPFGTLHQSRCVPRGARAGHGRAGRARHFLESAACDAHRRWHGRLDWLEHHGWRCVLCEWPRSCFEPFPQRGPACSRRSSLCACSLRLPTV